MLNYDLNLKPEFWNTCINDNPFFIAPFYLVREIILSWKKWILLWKLKLASTVYHLSGLLVFFNDQLEFRSAACQAKSSTYKTRHLLPLINSQKTKLFLQHTKVQSSRYIKNANSNRCIGSIKAKFAEFIIKHNSIGWVYISIYLSKEWNCFLINLVRNIIWFSFKQWWKKVIFNIITGSIVNREMTDALISAEFRVFFV